MKRPGTRQQINAVRKTNAHLVGGPGLLTAVIMTATLDYLDGRQDAATYFTSPLYHHHLDALGLPPDWLPEMVTI